ncbi:ester cyclase [Tunturiibacter gelidoferens]|uniref:Putative ester cyclase n=1 Tax=Tunturiibacter lichenicola TaxID=2051959 RepID=A0A7Y9NL23_9BACT|nr:putative ester cyclase [Edaphobacter lichenicola]
MKIDAFRLKSLPIAFSVAIGALALNSAAQQPAAHSMQGGGQMSNVDAHAATIHRLYEECLNQGRTDLLPELVTANVVNHTGSNEQRGLAAFEQGMQQVRAMYPDRHFTVDDVLTNGDKGAARWTMVATNTVPILGVAPTGRQLTNHGVVFYRFEGAKIAEVWIQVDQLGVLRQIGVQIPGLPAKAGAER